MKLKDSVVNLELSQEIKTLGVKQESLWYWVAHRIANNDFNIEKGWSAIPEDTNISAFTVAELGEMLPKEYSRSQKYKDYWLVWSTKYSVSQRANTEANAKAKMLIYLKERK